MRHAGDRRALMGVLTDLSFYQGRPPRSHADKSRAVCEAITQYALQHASHLATETKIAEWFISALTGDAILPADLSRILQLMTANKTSSHGDVKWPGHVAL